jgi:hypothetical protein
MAILAVNKRPDLAPSVYEYIPDNQVVVVTLAEIELALENVQVPVDLDSFYVSKMEELRAHLSRKSYLGRSGSPI